MPSQYSEMQKLQALEMLAIGDDVTFVNNMTGIPERTLRRWRKELDELPDGQMAEKSFFTPPGQHTEADFYAADATLADQPDNASGSDLENFTYVRDQLMRFARQAASDLHPHQPDSSRRTLALSRVLERIKWIDGLLPELAKNEERPPWQDAYDAFLKLNPNPEFLIYAENEANQLDPRLRAGVYEEFAERLLDFKSEE
ncbi:MAG: hypothetical protein OXG78_17450 [Chloroflexi bacterium]|nr:hypothetical protein [Chloroflexota bacterium]